MTLLQKKCVPCEGGTEPLSLSEAQAFLREVPEWKLTREGKSILREFTFKNFAQALAFGNTIGAIAEVEGHHPDLHIEWGKVTVELSTHAIKGLSENDFILAAKIDTI